VERDLGFEVARVFYNNYFKITCKVNLKLLIYKCTKVNLKL